MITPALNQWSNQPEFHCCPLDQVDEAALRDKIGVIALTHEYRDGTERIIFIHPWPGEADLLTQIRESEKIERVAALAPNRVCYCEEAKPSAEELPKVRTRLLSLSLRLRAELHPEVAS